MARKKPHEEHENHERWLVSYADFITLLFAFFVVMYSISSINEGKYRVLSDALISAFRQPQKSIRPIQVGKPAKSPVTSKLEFMNKPTAIQTPVMIVPQQKPHGDEGQEAKPGEGAGTGRGEANIDRIADEVERAMAPLVEQGLIAIRRNDLWLEVEIRDSILFPSASAQLQPDALPVLKEIAAILRDFPNPIRVEGFTDNLPINTLLYPSNWELSTARAASVVRLFDRQGIDPVRMSALGYGEYRPVASNDTPEGRARNRRVVLVVLADRQVEQLLDDRLRNARRRPPPVDQAPARSVSAGAVSAAAAPPAQASGPGAAPEQEDTTPPAARAVAQGPTVDRSVERNGDVARMPDPPRVPAIVPLPGFGAPVIDPPVKFMPPVRVPGVHPSGTGGGTAAVHGAEPFRLPARRSTGDEAAVSVTPRRSSLTGSALPAARKDAPSRPAERVVTPFPAAPRPAPAAVPAPPPAPPSVPLSVPAPAHPVIAPPIRLVAPLAPPIRLPDMSPAVSGGARR